MINIRISNANTINNTLLNIADCASNNCISFIYNISVNILINIASIININKDIYCFSNIKQDR